MPAAGSIRCSRSAAASPSRRVLVFIGWRIVNGRTTVGDFTGFVTALILAAQPIRALGNLNAIVQEAVAALQRAFAMMDEAPAIRERPERAALVVDARRDPLRARRFRYRDDASALDGIDLVAPAAKTTALVGRSGSGKSTLLSLVPRLYDVDRRRRPDRRHRTCATSTLAQPARRHRGGQPGRGSVRRHRAGQHRLRPAGRERRGDRRGREGRGRARVHHAAAGGLRRRGSATAATACPAASASASRSPAPSSRTRRSCSSTRRRARSIRNPSASCRTRSRG